MSEGYFSAAESPVSAEPGTFARLADGPSALLAPGLVTRPVAGRQTMMTYVTWERGAVAPDHSHHEEQIVFVLEGELEFRIGNETRIMHAGDVAVIPPLAAHGGCGRAEQTIVIEAFSPPRSGLLDLIRSTSAESPTSAASTCQ